MWKKTSLVALGAGLLLTGCAGRDQLGPDDLGTVSLQLTTTECGKLIPEMAAFEWVAQRIGSPRVYTTFIGRTQVDLHCSNLLTDPTDILATQSRFPGNYEVAIYVYDFSGNLIGEGNGSSTIAPGRTLSESITVTPVTGDATLNGSVSFGDFDAAAGDPGGCCCQLFEDIGDGGADPNSCQSLGRVSCGSAIRAGACGLWTANGCGDCP